MEKLMRFGIELALAFALAGKAKEGLIWMARHAAHAQGQMISLGALNRALVGSEGHRHEPAHH